MLPLLSHPWAFGDIVLLLLAWRSFFASSLSPVTTVAFLMELAFAVYRVECISLLVAIFRRDEIFLVVIFHSSSILLLFVFASNCSPPRFRCSAA
jgi:hypothetical protein